MAKKESKMNCTICQKPTETICCSKCQKKHLLDSNGYELKPIYTTGYEGNKFWYINSDKLHRTDGPAIECANGDKLWYLNGKLHRTDGPAVEWLNGYEYWYLNDKLHRTDGPAVTNVHGKSWYINGKLHRTDGPAVEYVNGDKKWYINDKKLTEQEFIQWQKDNLK